VRYFESPCNLPEYIEGGGRLLANTDAIEDVRFLFASGNIASGYYHAIGKKYS